MDPTRATADSRPTPRHREIIWFGKMSPRGQQLTADPHLDMEKLFGLEKWSPRGQQLTARPHLDIDKLFGLEKWSCRGQQLTAGPHLEEIIWFGKM